MKKLINLISLAAFLACAGCSVQVQGRWDEALPGHFISSTELIQDESYLIRNNTQETMYLWLLDDRTPIRYYPLLPGDVREFTSAGDSFDIYTHSSTGSGLGVSLWWLPN